MQDTCDTIYAPDDGASRRRRANRKAPSTLTNGRHPVTVVAKSFSPAPGSHRNATGVRVHCHGDVVPIKAMAQQAETMIRATGARLTRPRSRVLMFLFEQAHPLTHHDIHAQLPVEAIDTVTLYREEVEFLFKGICPGCSGN